MARIKITFLFFLAAFAFLNLSCNKGKNEIDSKQSIIKNEASKSDEKPSFLLITIDTWRSDYIGVSGSGKVETPNLDRLAKEGIYEMRAETPCPLTTPAHATILTGLLPLNHRILDCVGYVLPSSIPTLATLFKEKGYETAAFISSETLKSRYGLNKDFNVYDESGLEGKSLNLWDSVSKDGKETTLSVLKYINSRDNDTPQFLWVHYYDLHIPYRYREVYSEKYPNDPYAAQAAFVDGEISKLVKRTEIDKRKWRILVVGDHGEGLGDHNEPEHGLALYTETIHIPLIIYPKPEKDFLHPRPWRLEDIAPTICEWFGLKCGNIDGESLFSKGKEERVVYSFSILPLVQFGVNPVYGVRKGGFFYMKHSAEELYEVQKDPLEKNDLSKKKEFENVLKSLRAFCEKTFNEESFLKKISYSLNLSQEDLKNLQSLGYISGSGMESRNIQKADIREVCKDYLNFERVRLSEKTPQNVFSLKEAYKTIISKYPGAIAFYENYGLFLLGLNETDEALNAFEKAMRLDPKNLTVIVNLGSLYLLKGNSVKAKSLLETALIYEPDNLMVHKNLGILYSEVLNNPQKAVEHYKKYIELGGVADKNQIINYIREHSAK